MVYIVLFNFLIVCALYLALSNNHSKRLFVLFAIVLVFVAGFRDGHLFYDYEEYRVYIEDDMDSRLEPSFQLITSIVKSLSLPTISVFVIYAILGVGFKSKAILMFKSPMWLGMVVYIAHLYISEECTAIRVGVSTGIILLAFYQLCNKRMKQWLLLTILASLFHYSALVSVLYPLIIKIPANLKVCGSIIIGAYLIPLMGLSFDYLLDIANVSTAVYYSHYILTENVVNIYNFSQILYCLLALFVVKRIDKFEALFPYCKELVLIYIISLIVLPIFNSIPVFAYRSAHLFACVEIILLPIVIKYFWINKMRIASFFLIAYLFYWCNISALGAMALNI